MRKKFLYWLLWAIVWSVSLAGVAVGQVFGYEVITVSDGGSITGIVQYNGPRPVSVPLSISKDQGVCGKTEKMDETLLIGENNGLQNAVISLMNINQGKRFSSTGVTLDQKECRYVPHVLLIPIASDLTILNSDGILHNFHSHSTKNLSVNKPQPKFKQMMKERFNHPEIIKVTCDAHAWMSGWLVIIEHPYYEVTDAKGNFQLENIPPGEYQLQVWHEILKEANQSVKVLPRSTQRIGIEMVN